MQIQNLPYIEPQDETKFAKYLYGKCYLKGPEKCSCANNVFSIQKYSNNKIAGCCFRCPNNYCRKIYPIRANSFFDKFSKG